MPKQKVLFVQPSPRQMQLISPLVSHFYNILKRLNAKFVSITQGPKGLYNHNSNSSFRVPALSSKVVDRVGVGDAFLALSSISLGSGIDPEIAIFTGAAAAAIDVQIVGNKTTVNRVDLEKYLTALLK